MKCQQREKKYRTDVNGDCLISVPYLEHVLMTHQVSKYLGISETSDCHLAESTLVTSHQRQAHCRFYGVGTKA